MPTNEIRIDNLALSDLDAVVRIYSEVIGLSYVAYGELTEGFATPRGFSKQAPKLFAKEVRASIKSSVWCVYVARYKDRLVGFVYVELKKSPAGHRECWILDLGVSKKFRRMGIAQRLLAAAYKFGRVRKVKYFFLESGEGNTRAHRLFEKEGFSPLATIFVKEN